MFPINPSSTSVGALWMTVDSTTEQFPDDGAGLSTTTAEDSYVAGATQCVLEGITLITDGSATTIDITDGATNVIDTFPIPPAGSEGVLSQWGIDGLDRPGAFGAKLSSGTGTVVLWFRVIFPEESNVGIF